MYSVTIRNYSSAFKIPRICKQIIFLVIYKVRSSLMLDLEVTHDFVYLFLLFAYQSYFDFQTFPIFVFEISTDFTLVCDLRCVFFMSVKFVEQP